MSLIPDKLYKQIVASVPIPCVDVFVTCGGEFLLGRRAIEPEKGKWWPAGGHVERGELIKETASRETKEEFGINAAPDRFEFLLVEETIFNNPDGSILRHTINSVFKLELIEKPIVTPAVDEFSEVKWLQKIEEDWHPYVKLCLEKAGFTLTPKK